MVKMKGVLAVGGKDKWVARSRANKLFLLTVHIKGIRSRTEIIL